MDNKCCDNCRFLTTDLFGDIVCRQILAAILNPILNNGVEVIKPKEFHCALFENAEKNVK